MNGDIPSPTEHQPERSPLYDNPALIKESHGDEELLDLLVKREMLFDEGVSMRRSFGEIPEDHTDKIKDVNQQIKELRQQLGLSLYE